MSNASFDDLIFDTDPDLDAIRVLEDRLYEFNIQATGHTDGVLYDIFLHDQNVAENGGADVWTWGATCYFRAVDGIRAALAQVGCPDRRIDRLCITCCWPSQLSHHAGCRRDRSRRECDGLLVAITSGHHGPRHSCDLVGERDRSDLGRPPRQQCGKPGPMFGAMDLGIADDGERTRGEQAAQIAIALFADTAELVLAPARVLLRHKPDPGRKIPPRSESLRISDAGDQSRGEHRTNAGNLIQPLARLIGSVPGYDLTVKVENLHL